MELQHISCKQNWCSPHTKQHPLTSYRGAAERVAVLVKGGTLYQLPKVGPTHHIGQPVPWLAPALVPSSTEPIPIQGLTLQERVSCMVLL